MTNRTSGKENSCPKPKNPTAAIRALNDGFRRTFIGGRVMVTQGVQALGETEMAAVLQRVQTFDAFDEANDPHHEHDFGAIDLDGQKLFWKIDYYDKTMDYGSPDPSDPKVTTRVLTVMLAEEY